MGGRRLACYNLQPHHLMTLYHMFKVVFMPITAVLKSSLVFLFKQTIVLEQKGFWNIEAMQKTEQNYYEHDGIKVLHKNLFLTRDIGEFCQDQIISLGTVIWKIPMKALTPMLPLSSLSAAHESVAKISIHFLYLRGRKQAGHLTTCEPDPNCNFTVNWQRALPWNMNR